MRALRGGSALNRELLCYDDKMKNTITSKDGTEIAYYSQGYGPDLLILPGNNRMAHNYDKLCSYLVKDFTVHVIERRGRGESGPQGDDYSIECETEDLYNVLEATGAPYVFGHSYGGLIALQAAIQSASFEKLIVYEPGVSIQGSFNGAWLAEFTELIKRNKQVQAMALFLKETKLAPISNLPMPLLNTFSRILLSGRSGKEMRDMMNTTPYEINEIIRLDSDGKQYGQIKQQTLLLGGTKTPSYITDVLPLLYEYIQHSEYKLIQDLDHNAPDLNAPERIANEIRLFLKTR